jgi:hypothetical protein
MEHATLERRRREAGGAPETVAGQARRQPGELGRLAAALNAAPAVQRLNALSGVIQRVIAVGGDGIDGARQRLGQRGVPGEVVDEYHGLVGTYTEDEVVLAYKGPDAKKPMQSSFPKLIRIDGDQEVEETGLIFRGMSINNASNLKESASSHDNSKVIFNAQNPQGQATAVQHIVSDDPDSPYLSFEARGYDISAGKYAPKPIGANRKPRGVRREQGGFLKQKPSYTGESRRDYPDAPRVGYVGGIDPQGLNPLDVSTEQLAQQHLNNEDARRIAVNDREVLVQPGEGIPRSRVPFVAKVKEVTKDYYDRKEKRQTPTKALGFYKPANAPASTKTRFYKAQIPDKYELQEHPYRFDIPPHRLKQEEDQGSDISDVESVDLDLSDGDFSDQEEDEQVADQDLLPGAQEQVGEHQEQVALAQQDPGVQ